MKAPPKRLHHNWTHNSEPPPPPPQHFREQEVYDNDSMQTSPMIHPSPELQSLPGSRIRVIFHPGALDDLGRTAKREGAARALLVTDPGIVEAGHVERATRSLSQAGIVTRPSDGAAENPPAHN